MKKIDMSEKAVMRRLRQVDQLNELCLALVKAGRAHFEKMRTSEKEAQSDSRQSKKQQI